MTANTVCTVVRIIDEIYERVGVYPCLWQETESFAVKKYGTENVDKALIFIPGISADIKKEDYIFKGEIAGNPDMSRALTATSVTRCDYGSPCMQHIEVRVRWRQDIR